MRGCFPRLGLLVVTCAVAACTTAKAVELIGYVPNYRMTSASYVNNVLPGQLALLDEVRYFGITVTSTGGLTTTATNRSQLQTLVQKINALPVGKRPRLDITLGGAGASGGFSAIAASAILQATLAQNVAALLQDTGATGVDVDWEHPADGAELTTRYPQLLGRIKQELGAASRVYATVDPSKILPKSVFDGANGIDGVSLMTYDLGWWANDQADPNLGQHSLPQYVTDSVNAWTNTAGASIPRTYVFGSKKSVDAPESKLGIGAPFYGRGFNGSSPDLAVAYSDLVTSGTTTDGNAYVYQGSNVWLPGKQMLADRVDYANQKGLESIIFWEMFHDLPANNPNSLLKAAYDADLRHTAASGDFNRDGAADGADLEIWISNFGLGSGANAAAGDANGDGAVDGADFLIWQEHSNGASPAAGYSGVPEPTGAILCALMSAALTHAHIRR